MRPPIVEEVTLSESSATEERTSEVVDGVPGGRAQRTSLPGDGRQHAKIEFIQVLRGLSVLLVVWGHLGPAWLAGAGWTWKPMTWWNNGVVGPFHLFQDGAHMGVLVFFLISGFIITHASLREDRLQFAVKRVLRIFPLLLIALLVASGLQMLARHLELGGVWGVADWSTSSFLQSFLLVNWATGDHRMLGPTWTLEIEILFYLLTFVVISGTRIRPKAATWTMVGLWVVLNVVTFLVWPGTFGAAHHPVYVGFLIIGRVIYLASRRMVETVDAVLLGATSAALLVLFHTAGFPGELFGAGAGSLAAQVGALLVFLVAMRAGISRSVQPFRFFGDISYSLYLLHVPVGMFLNNVGANLGLPFTVTLLVSVSASIGAAALSYRFLEKPFQSLARRVLRGHTPKDPTLVR